MGPIGILCVQRTLNKGRESGLYTGIGAALSDLIYCLFTGLGMSIVTDWIEANVSILQVMGSVFLIAYAIYMIVHNPVQTVQDTNIKGDLTRDMVTGFFFTLSNPLIVFLVIPLFARFGFPLPEHRFYHIILGYVFIVAGALLWWTVITYSVDKVRSHFSVNSMWLINKVMGGLLLLLSLYGLGTGIWDYVR
ncbi:MAG: LysE family transporter [Muribaculaceae bacterium]|nr:LysE family transporter [Muribaculaceae bacterium]